MSASAARHLVADVEADGGEDVALFAVCIDEEGDVRAAVGIVLDALDRCGDAVLIALEIDDAVLALVAAADVADRDPAGVVSAAGLALILEEGALRLVARELFLVVGNGHETARRGGGFISLDCHNTCILLS